jgi:hypothetical protein
MRTNQWQTYRTRFLVKAKQLNSNLSFTDHLGRHHCGRKGDYLVESSDGVLSIASRRIFEDIYVPMTPLNAPPPGRVAYATLHTSPVESLQVENLQIRKVPTRAARRVAPHSAVRPKAPQPVRSTRHPVQLGLM